MSFSSVPVVQCWTTWMVESFIGSTRAAFLPFHQDTWPRVYFQGTCRAFLLRSIQILCPDRSSQSGKDKNMNITVNNTNKNVATLTFAELKAMVPGTGKEKLPKVKKLKESKAAVLFTAEDAGMVITVYANGYYTAAKNGFITVYAVDRCSSIEYHFDDGTSMTVPESEFADGCWLMPLSLVADHRLEDSSNHRESYMAAFTADTIGTETRQELAVPDYVTQLEMEELERGLVLLHQKRVGLLGEAIAHLAKRQRQVVDMYFNQDMTQSEIASALGLSNPTVKESLDSAIRRMKTFFEKNI